MAYIREIQMHFEMSSILHWARELCNQIPLIYYLHGIAG